MDQDTGEICQALNGQGAVLGQHSQALQVLTAGVTKISYTPANLVAPPFLNNHPEATRLPIPMMATLELVETFLCSVKLFLNKSLVSILLTEPRPRFSPPTASVLQCFPDPEPMQLGQAKLLPEERQHQINSKSCLYCGHSDHFLLTCPLLPVDNT